MGQERITQPTIFYGPVSALGGFYPPTGGGTLSGEYTAFFKTWTLTGDGVTTRYSLYSDQVVLPYSENFIVNIDGVMQTPGTYTIDAIYKYIDFYEPVPLSSVLTIVQIATLVTPDAPPLKYSTFYANWQYTGDGNTNTYSLPTTGVLISDSENYIVTINGIVKTPTTYTIDTTNSQIILDSNVSNGSLLSITQIGTLRKDTFSVYSYDFNTWSFSISSTLSALPLSGAPVDLSPKQGAYLVSIDGVTQAPGTDFNVDINAQTITFTTPLLSGSLVRVQQLGSLGITIEDDIMSKYLSLSGGTINGNLVIVGALTALSGVNFITTNFTTTSALSVNNSGFGPALTVRQNNAQTVLDIGNNNGSSIFVAGNNTVPGFVGINTKTPNERLTVVGNISALGTQVIEASSSSTALRVTQAGTGNAFLVEDAANDGTPFVITSDGRIGIGILNPNSKVSIVEDDVNAFRISSNDTHEYYAAFGTTLSAGYFTAGSAFAKDVPLIFRTALAGAETEKVRFAADGKVGIGTTTPNEALTVVGNISASGSILAAGSNFVINGGNTLTTDLSVGTTNNQNLVLETNNTTRMFISSSGNVGINTPTPNERLTVNGNISASGVIYPGSNYGFIPNLSASLQFTNAYGLSGGKANKILLWPGDGPGLDGNYGFGIAASELSYLGENHIFYTPTTIAATSSVMIISNTGNVGIGANEFTTLVKPTKTLEVRGSVEFDNSLSNSGILFNSFPIIERTNVISGRANDTINIDVKTSNVWMFLSASNTRWIHNIRGSSTTPLSNLMSPGDSLNLTVFSQQSSRSFFTSAIRIDNVEILPRWFSNSIPVSSVSLSGFDVYSWSIIKINDPSSYRVLGSVSQYG